MADVDDRAKIKKKTIRRIYQKPEREFETFLPESMRAPVIQVLGKPPHEYKNSPSPHHDVPYHHHHWDKRGGRYQDGEGNWDKRAGSYGGVLRVGDGHRNAIFSRDAGRPPGRTDGEGGDGEASPAMTTPTPVILSRARSGSDQRSTSPNPAAAATTPRKDSVSNMSATGAVSTSQLYQIASKPLMLEASLTPERVMRAPLRLLDEGLGLGEDLTPYLLDQSNFLVVAVVGLQGVGKSALASFLVDPSTNLRTPRSCKFRVESVEQVMSGSHATSGVEVWVTGERLLVLDCQPLLSPAIMDRFIMSPDKKYTSDYSSTENLMEVESLQVLTLALSVAHVVLVVQDGCCGPDPALLRLLHTCHMVKPAPASSTPATSSSSSAGSGLVSGAGEENPHQYYPHVVFVHNRAPPHHFSPATLKTMQSVYREALAGCGLESESRLGLCNSLTYAPLAFSSCGSLINLFLLPDLYMQDQSPVSLEDAVREMRREVLSVRRLPLTHLTLTEKSWYQYVGRTWDTIRKWSLFVEYSRLLP